MRRQLRALSSAALVGSLLLAGCAEPSEAPEAPATEIPASGELPTGHPNIDQAPAPVAGGGPSGVVLETMDSGGYTYVRLEVEGEEIWAAGPVTAMTVGDSVGLVGAMGMQDFTSNTLGRTFEQILFVSGFGAAAGSASAAGGATASADTFAGNSGLVTETMDSGGYTYALVEIEGQSMWLAGPQTTVAVGQTVGWMDGMFMQDFASGTLDRTFEAILFVNALTVLN
jgi:hypothetical protein